MHTIRVITLDLDDTLWAIHPVIRRAETAMYEWMQQHRPAITAMHDRDDLRALRKEVVRDHSERSHELSFIRQNTLERAAERAGVSADFVDTAFAVFDEQRNNVELFPEVLPALEALRSRFRLIAVTNGNADLQRIGIDHFFDAAVTATTAGAAKPAQQIFDTAVAAGGAPASQTLHVGDHALMDVDGGRRAGLMTCWVNRNNADWPEEYERATMDVRDIGELATLLLTTTNTAS